ncbi:MAG: anhydro-N-acetylmuramic acid kinase [Verrucomicrobiales bacterium]|nr:anhydro-N-acetylmuramic acid kinase [Verrucomicrobiales bacterium]
MRAPRTVLGLMSGTSMDAVDGVEVRFRGRRLELLRVWSVAYPAALRKRLMGAASNAATCWETAALHHDLGRFYADCARRHSSRNGVEAVGLHGQTVFHGPSQRGAATLQLGEPAYLARELGVPVVSNFRSADMAVGGQGAPLATLFHVRVFARRGRRVCVQNLGGIGNVTSIDCRSRKEPMVQAFDTGPANLLLDLAMQRLTAGRRTMDRDGQWAARGCVADDLVRAWLRHPFFRRPPPKSTGREMFGAPYLNRLWSDMDDRQLGGADRLATLTEFTARSVALNYRWHLVGVPDEVVLCGGGAKNPALVRNLEVALHREIPGIRLTRCDAHGWPTQAVEGAAFALLARECLMGKPGNLPETTGARQAVRCGQITHP